MQNFPNSIKPTIEKNLNGILRELGVSNPIDLEYVLLTDPKEPYQYNNFDDIYRMWQTPIFTGIRLDFDAVIYNLVQTENTAPLRINVSLQKDIVILEFSQRFRKQKVIQEAHQNNKYAPFIASIEKLEFTPEMERRAKIRVILFAAKLNHKFLDQLTAKVSSNELKTYMQWHFNTYRFYPANVNDNYSGLIIEKDFKTKKFNLYSDGKIEKKIESELSLEQVLHLYLESQGINNTMFGLTVTAL